MSTIDPVKFDRIRGGLVADVGHNRDVVPSSFDVADLVTTCDETAVGGGHWHSEDREQLALLRLGRWRL